MRRLVSLLLEHAAGRLADDVLLVLGEPSMTPDPPRVSLARSEN